MTQTRTNLATISITQDNLSHFNKRLQKALKESLGIDVKLTQAADIFAKACGKNSTYEIQQILSQEKEKTSFVDFLSQEKTEIIDKFFKKCDLNSYENFTSFKIHKVMESLFFQFSYKNKDKMAFEIKVPLTFYENRKELVDAIQESTINCEIEDKDLSIIYDLLNMFSLKNEEYFNSITKAVAQECFKEAVQVNQVLTTTLYDRNALEAQKEENRRVSLRNIKNLYKQAEPNILRNFKFQLNLLNSSTDNISLKMFRENGKYFFHFVYYNGNDFFHFDLEFKHFENFDKAIYQVLNGKKLHQKHITAIENFYASFFDNNESYADLIAESIWNDYHKNAPVDTNEITFSVKSNIRNLVRIGNEYYRPTFKVTLRDIAEYDGTEKPFIFKELKPALKCLNFYCYENEHPEMTFTAHYECMNNFKKTYSTHYRLSNHSGEWKTINNNERLRGLNINDIKEKCELVLYGDPEKVKAQRMMKNKKKTLHSHTTYYYR